MSWLFLDRPRAVDHLVKRLERLGVKSVVIEDSDSAYVPARTILTVPWKGDLEIIWHRQWEPDGVWQRDCFVSLKFGDDEERIVDVSKLFRQKLEKPLVEVIVDHISEAVQRHLGNPVAGKPVADDKTSDGVRHDDLP